MHILSEKDDSFAIAKKPKNAYDNEEDGYSVQEERSNQEKKKRNAKGGWNV